MTCAYAGHGFASFSSILAFSASRAPLLLLTAVALGASPAAGLVAYQTFDFGSVAVNTAAPAAHTLTFKITSAGTIAAPQVLTMGAPNLDFTDAGTGTCTTNGTGHTYKAGDTCTVDAKFAPKYAGTRKGAVVLSNLSGARIATAYIYGTGTGPQAAFSPLTISNLGGGLTPGGMEVDGGGNVYVVDRLNSSVKKVPAGCTSSACVATLKGGFSEPYGLALDGAGNVYVTDLNGAQTVTEIPPGCVSSSCLTQLGGNLYHPDGVTVDASGNVYVAEGGNRRVVEMPPGCESSECMTTLGAGFRSPSDVAVDGSGNVYVADFSVGVKEMPAGCASSACVTTLGGGPKGLLRWARSIAVDGGGNIYANPDNWAIVAEMPAGCASPACIATLIYGLFEPFSLAVDAGGNVYTNKRGTHDLEEFHRATPRALGFASTKPGATSSDSPKTVTVQNIGNQPLQMSEVSYSKDFPEASGVDTDCTSSTELSPGLGSCTLSIDFSPEISSLTGASTSLSEQVSVTSNHLNVADTVHSVTVTGTAVASVLFGWFDRVINTRTHSNILTQSDTLKVWGWAADEHDGAPVSQVQIRIDGTAVGDATLGLSRPDVKNYPNSGWSFTYPAAGFSLGNHLVEMESWNSLGNSAIRTGTFSVAATSTGPPFGFLELAVDSSTKSTNVRQAGSLMVAGWAADPQDGAPVSRVRILIDGTAVGDAALGLSRPDVSYYPKSGWYLKVSASGLSLGAHTVSAVATNSQRWSTTLGTKTITVTTGP